MTLRTVCIISTLLSFLITFSCLNKNNKIFKKSKFLMDTVATITVVTDSEDEANIAIEKAFIEIEKIERITNSHSKNSEISLVNNKSGIEKIKVSDTLFDIISKSVDISKKTNNAFDVTIGSITSMYNFYKKIKPDHNIIKNKLPLINNKYIKLDKINKTMFLNKKGMSIDLGGIAKGYAVDRAVDILKSNNIKSGIVSIGGDIKTFGLKPDNKPWKIGIRDPFSHNKHDIFAIIELSNMSISTSGDYERYFIIEGKKYHHIISPFNGLPATECKSVTVIAEDCYLTDSFATGVFILGPEKGINILKNAGIEGIIVDKNGKLFLTDGIRKKIEFKKKF